MMSPCPICSKPARPEFRPFCSKRCADIDLSRWLKGSYAIPGPAAGEDEGEGSERPQNGGSGAADKGMDSD